MRRSLKFSIRKFPAQLFFASLLIYVVAGCRSTGATSIPTADQTRVPDGQQPIKIGQRIILQTLKTAHPRRPFNNQITMRVSSSGPSVITGNYVHEDGKDYLPGSLQCIVSLQAEAGVAATPLSTPTKVTVVSATGDRKVKFTPDDKSFVEIECEKILTVTYDPYFTLRHMACLFDVTDESAFKPQCRYFYAEILQ